MNQKLVVKKAFHLYLLFYKKIYHLSQRLRVQNASSARNSVSFETNLMICNEIPCEQWILSGMDS